METPKASTFSKSTLLWIATVAIFLYGMIASVAGTIVPRLSSRMHLTPEQIGTLFLMQAVGMMVASLAAGPLVDSQGKKAGMLASLGLITLALICLPLSSSQAAMLACVTVLGLGGGSLTTTASALLSDINPARRAVILTITKSSYGVGGFLTPMIGATLLAGNTVLLCYLIAMLASVLLVVTAFVMFPAASLRRFDLSLARRLLRKPLLYILSLAMFFYVACEVGMFNWLPKYLILRGLPEKSALTAVSAGFALGLLVGRLVFAAVLLRVPVRAVAVASAIGMAVATSLLLDVHDASTATVVAFAAGLAMAPVFPSIVAMIGDHFPTATATAMGIAITSGWAGLATSSRLIGTISNKAAGGIATGMLVLPAFSTVLIVFMLILWMLLRLPRPAVTGIDSEPATLVNRA